MKKACQVLLAVSFALAAVACGSASTDEEVGATDDALSVKSSFVSRGTAYYPSNSSIEGGFKDRKGLPLKTLQQFLAGQASYVSVAMDTNAFAYGTRLRINELDRKYGRSIVFRVVDTGGAFRGKGKSRIDICVKNAAASTDPTINGTLHIDVMDERNSPPPNDDGANDEGSGQTGNTGEPVGSDDPPASSSSSSGGGGQSCSSDGQCNPGNDGSGLICVGGQCVPGCKTNAQCPGSTTCRSGQCQ